MNPQVIPYDLTIGYNVYQYKVEGSFGAGLSITVSDGLNSAVVNCINGDTAETVAAKIVAAWNIVTPDSANTIAPRNDFYNVVNPINQSYPNLIQLKAIQPPQFSFSQQPANDFEAVAETGKKNWLWLLLAAGGAYLLLKKKRK